MDVDNLLSSLSAPWLSWDVGDLRRHLRRWAWVHDCDMEFTLTFITHDRYLAVFGQMSSGCATLVAYTIFTEERFSLLNSFGSKGTTPFQRVWSVVYWTVPF